LAIVDFIGRAIDGIPRLATKSKPACIGDKMVIDSQGNDEG